MYLKLVLTKFKTMDYPSELNDKIEYLKSLKRVTKPLKKEILLTKMSFIVKHNRRYLTKRFLVAASIIAALGFGGLYFLRPIIVQTRTERVSSGEVIYLADSTKTMEKFLFDIGKRESNGKYNIVNQFGYLGKYQFGRSALTAIGLGSISNEKFLSTPELQETAMIMLLRQNKQTLAPYIGKYQSKVIGGVYITESGILAACHMAPQGAIDFLTSNGAKVFKDGNGVAVTRYFEDFSGYKIEL